MNLIPVVIIHTGYKDYLKTNLEVTGQTNKIYLIGDKDNKHLSELKNVTWINLEEYNKTKKINEFSEKFINFSSNRKDFELFCFLRVYIISEFMTAMKFEKVFHIDSDNILFHNINNVIDVTRTAYHVNQNYGNIYRMSDSIHNGLITQEFLRVFFEICHRIYIKKDLSLIKDKIEYHKKVNGGICDMTIYYLMRSEKFIDPIDLNVPRDGKVFINNYNCSDGWESRNQYVMENGKIKIWKKDGKNMIFDTINKQFFELINIHFQGTAKKYISKEWFDENLV